MRSYLLPCLIGILAATAGFSSAEEPPVVAPPVAAPVDYKVLWARANASAAAWKADSERKSVLIKHWEDLHEQDEANTKKGILVMAQLVKQNKELVSICEIYQARGLK